MLAKFTHLTFASTVDLVGKADERSLLPIRSMGGLLCHFDTPSSLVGVGSEGGSCSSSGLKVTLGELRLLLVSPRDMPFPNSERRFWSTIRLSKEKMGHLNKFTLTR